MITWKDFYNERSFNPEAGKFHYTHQCLRTAYRSLVNNAHYLFSYKRHPQIGIPNTSNKIEGEFSQLKRKLRFHNGVLIELKIKMIDEILGV